MRVRPFEIREWQRWLKWGNLALLPTFWSNWLAGWWLGGGKGAVWRTLWGFGAFTLVVVATQLVVPCAGERDPKLFGTNLTDGEGVRLRRLGWLMLSFGCTALALGGVWVAICSLMLVMCLIGSSLLGRAGNLTPLCEGITRMAVYWVGALNAGGKVSGYLVFGGLAIAAYVAGIACLDLATTLGSRGRRQKWVGWCLIVVPLIFGLLLNRGDYLERTIGWELLFLLWSTPFALLWRRRAEDKIEEVKAGLFVAVPIVDAIGAVDSPLWFSLLFVTLFVLAFTTVQARAVP